MRAAETLLWVFGVVVFVLTAAAVLANGRAPKRPVPPEPPPVTEDDIDRWIADWDLDK